MKAKIIPWKIKEVLPEGLPISSSVMPQAPLLRRVRRPYWSDRTGYGNKAVIGGAQWREKTDRVSRRISCEKEVKYIGALSKAVRDSGRVLNKLLQVIEDRKDEGLFTRWISERRGEPKAVVNIEISKYRDFRERRNGKNVFHFRSKIVKEFCIVSRVRG